MPTTPRHQRPTKLKKFLFGCPYYPEHWTPETRELDPKRMAAAGVNVVRMGEFAWDLMEPRRDEFHFELFDQTIERLGAAGIDTIFCTPTATPPRWLTFGHDDWQRVDDEGHRMQHGSRQHVCTTNEEFRAESRRITEAMARHFAGSPHVIGWQTDNELYCHMSRCYCDACQTGFREFLRQKYKTIDRLNAAWGAAFWSQTVDGFESILLPTVRKSPCWANPSQALDHHRFLSHSVSEFQRQQVEILRKAHPSWFVMHNGMFPHVDYWEFTKDLDFLGVDIYPGYSVRSPQESHNSAWSAESARAASGSFIVPEQQSGAGGQRDYVLPTPPPGQMRLWAYQSIAHGADGMMHFRWRTCRFGIETYWCGVLDHDNVPRRRYEEFSREGNELARIGPKLLGTTLDVRAAVLTQYEQTGAHDAMPLGYPSPDEQARQALRAMLTRHLPCGLVDARDDFAGLDLVVVPSMMLCDEPLAKRLEAFVRAGGVLLATARTATKTFDNHATAQTPPGLLASLFGATVEEFGRIEPAALTIDAGGKAISSGNIYEILKANSAQVLGAWKTPGDAGPTAAAGQPAITANRVGKGTAIYFASFITPENAQAVLELALSYAKIEPLAQADECVEVTRRVGPDGKFVFVLNHYTQPHTATVGAGKNLITGKPCNGKIELEPYGVAVIEQN